MVTLLIAIGSLVGYLVAYHTYGRWLSRRVFKLDPAATVPSVELNDNRDFVPTRRSIVFGHHFTSIAGTGPIVGPAIAVMWGWLPALLWVLLGSIFIGAVHDLGALVVSLRNRGQTVGDIAGRVLNRRVRLLFLLVLFMALSIVLAIFGLVIAAVFRLYPAAIFPCLVQVPVAVLIGLWLHRRGMNLLLPSLLALAMMYATVLFGDWGPLHAVNEWFAGWPTIAWVGALLGYSYIASVLPVWTLLQPRDYINSLQLLTSLGLIVAGLVAAAVMGGAPPVEGADRVELQIVAPVANFAPEAAPVIFPFLFITIACGAISGFHCLVSSGTSSKQLKCETDARFVGYGSMLTEGFLAVLVILACVAGIGLGIEVTMGASASFDDVIRIPATETERERFVLVGSSAYTLSYGNWFTAGSLGNKVGAFVNGAGNFLKAMGIPAGAAVALIGVLVASFAGTTLDTACRLQRYVVQELAGTFVRRGESTAASASNPLAWLTNKHAATIFAIVLGGALAAMPGPGMAWSLKTAGTGGLILWPLFGATNQLLAGLAFLVIAFWLWRRRLPTWFVVVPMVFMLIMPAWALIWQLFVSNPGTAASPTGTPGWLYAEQKNWALLIVAAGTLALEVWMIVEAILLWPKARGVLEQALPPLGAQPTNEGDG